MKNAEGEDILVPEGQSKIWNYHPNLPVPNSPVFRWRPRIGFVLNWFRHGWFALSGATIWVALAFVVFTWFQPSLAQWSSRRHYFDASEKPFSYLYHSRWITSVALGHAVSR